MADGGGRFRLIRLASWTVANGSGRWRMFDDVRLGSNPMRLLRPRLNHRDDVARLVTEPTRVLQHLSDACEYGTFLCRSHDADAPTASEVEDALIPEDMERANHGVLVDAKDGREVHCGRQSIPWCSLALRNRTPNLSCDLEVEGSWPIPVECDANHGTSPI